METEERHWRLAKVTVYKVEQYNYSERTVNKWSDSDYSIDLKQEKIHFLEKLET